MDDHGSEIHVSGRNSDAEDKANSGLGWGCLCEQLYNALVLFLDIVHFTIAGGGSRLSESLPYVLY